MPIKHPFVSNIPDGTDPTLVRPSNWNADHSVTFTQAELSSVLDGALGTITGLLIGRGASLWSPISVGLSGQLLQSQGSLALPQWSSLTASGISVFGTPLINQITGWGNAATILALSIGNNLSLVASTLAAIVSGLSVAGVPLPNQLAGWNNAATVAPISIGANVSLTNGTLSASGSGASAVSVAGSPTSLNLTAWQNQTTITSIFIGANLSLSAGTLSATGGGSGGGVSVTGSPAAGNLTRWTSGATITNADLAGDVTTSGSTITAIKASVSLAGAPTTNTPAVGNNSTSIATTAFVTTAINNAIAGVNPAVAVQAATTQASDTSGLTYNNGVSGVGATFTGVANTALTWDGFTFTAVGQRGLCKNDTQIPSGAFNGVYFVSQIQTALVPIILTRALDYDTPSDINNTGAIPVVNGTVNGSTTWVLTSSVTTVGNDPLTYTQFSLKPSTIITVTGTPSAGDIAQFSGSTSIKTSSIASLNMLANTLASIGPAVPVSLSAFIDSAIGSTRGAILERGATQWGLVPPGTSGYVLTSNGAGADPAYSIPTPSGGVYPFVNLVVPTGSGFNWINQGTSSVNIKNGVLVQQCLGNGGDALRFYGVSVPAASFTAVAAFIPSPGINSGLSLAGSYSEGLAITDGTRFKSFWIAYNPAPASIAGATNVVLQIAYYSTASIFISSAGTRPFNAGTLNWFRIQDNGATRTYAISVDPVNQGWQLIFSEPHTSSVTPSQVGFLTDIFGGGLNGISIGGMPWLSWSLSSP